jgi:hypothetical protein
MAGAPVAGALGSGFGVNRSGGKTSARRLPVRQNWLPQRFSHLLRSRECPPARLLLQTGGLSPTSQQRMPSATSVAANRGIIPYFAAENALGRVCCCKRGDYPLLRSRECPRRRLLLQTGGLSPTSQQRMPSAASVAANRVCPGPQPPTGGGPWRSPLTNSPHTSRRADGQDLAPPPCRTRWIERLFMGSGRRRSASSVTPGPRVFSPRREDPRM